MTMLMIDVTPRRAQFTTIVRSEEATDGSIEYRAEIPEFPGCMSHGETPEEARQNLEEAKELYIETLNEQGRPVPRPIDATRVSSTSGTALSGSTARRIVTVSLEARLTLRAPVVRSD